MPNTLRHDGDGAVRGALLPQRITIIVDALLVRRFGRNLLRITVGGDMRDKTDGIRAQNVIFCRGGRRIRRGTTITTTSPN